MPLSAIAAFVWRLPSRKLPVRACRIRPCFRMTAVGGVSRFGKTACICFSCSCGTPFVLTAPPDIGGALAESLPDNCRPCQGNREHSRSPPRGGSAAGLFVVQSGIRARISDASPFFPPPFFRCFPVIVPDVFVGAALDKRLVGGLRAEMLRVVQRRPPVDVPGVSGSSPRLTRTAMTSGSFIFVAACRDVTRHADHGTLRPPHPQL